MKSIERKINLLLERLARLRFIADELKSFVDYEKSMDKKDIVERGIQISIETCLDIGKIIISGKGLPEPKDNKGIFVVLAQAGLISDESLNFWFQWPAPEMFSFMVMTKSMMPLFTEF